MPVNDTTTNRGYQKPNVANTLSNDVGRLRAALDAIDTDITTALAAQASTTYTFSSAAPSTPAVGDRWTDADDGITYQYVNDGTSSQWVELGPAGANAAMPKAGGTFTGNITLAAGTSNISPLTLASGTNLTNAVAGAIEYDGAVGYFTPDATGGRGFLPSTQTFRLTSAGSLINNNIANFFGPDSNIPLVANAFYEIDIYMLALRGANSGTATITLTNSASPTLMFVDYEQSPLSGVAAPPGSVSQLTNLNFRGTTTTTTAAYAFTTGSLSASVNHYFRFKLFLQNGTGTSLKIQMTAGSGNNSMTPQAGSAWFCRRLPGANTGTFAA